jgi:hypothetical protein
MSKLVLALLSDDNQLQKFEEIDMSWADKFNEEFKKNEIPFNEEVYKEEFVDMTSFAVLKDFVITENDDEFKVDRTPLKNKLAILLYGDQLQKPEPQ